jgi:hypothetical protein
VDGSLDTLARCLKYGGVVLTGLFVVWSTLFNDFKERAPNGGLGLTLAGRWFIALSIGFIFLSLAGMVLEDLRTRREEAERAAREAITTRKLLLAGNDLRTLQIEWTFPNVPADVLEQIAAGEKQIEEQVRLRPPPYYRRPRREDTADLRRQYQVHPFINVLGGGKWEPEGAKGRALLISFNPTHTVVLPLGYLDVERDDDGRTEESVAASFDLPTGPDALPRARQTETDVELVVSGTSVTLRWILSPQALDLCLDRSRGDEFVSPVLPDILKLISLSDMSDAPFRPENSTICDAAVPWDAPPSGVVDTPFSESSLVVQPNNLPDAARIYRVQPILRQHCLLEIPWGRMHSSNAGTVTAWEAAAITTSPDAPGVGNR